MIYGSPKGRWGADEPHPYDSQREVERDKHYQPSPYPLYRGWRIKVTAGSKRHTWAIRRDDAHHAVWTVCGTEADSYAAEQAAQRHIDAIHAKGATDAA